MNKIIVPREFISFLQSINKVNDSAILSVEPDKIICLVGSPDSTIFAYGNVSDCENNFTGSLQVGSISRLLKGLQHVTDEKITLLVNSNNLEYKSTGLRFKYHLAEDGVLSQPAFSISKIITLTFDVTFDVMQSKLIELGKLESFAVNSNKVYLKGVDGKVYAELTDKAKDNIDSVQVEFGECPTSFDDIPLNLEFIRAINYNKHSSIKMKINTIYSCIIIDISNDSNNLRYISSALTS